MLCRFSIPGEGLVYVSSVFEHRREIRHSAGLAEFGSLPVPFPGAYMVSALFQEVPKVGCGLPVSKIC